MVTKKVLVLGASGQIGRHLIRKLTKNNYVVTAVTRNLHQKGYSLKTQSPIGFLEIIEANIFNQEKLNNIIKNHEICINLIGILFEKKNNTFQNIHVNFPSILSKICKENNIEKLIHISALGIEKSIDSNYAISKLEGENKIKKNFERYIILKPSIVPPVNNTSDPVISPLDFNLRLPLELEIAFDIIANPPISPEVAVILPLI